jgi:hypothetical protein
MAERAGAWLRYLDIFAKIDGGWYVAERKLILDWSETRPWVRPPPPDCPRVHFPHSCARPMDAS